MRSELIDQIKQIVGEDHFSDSLIDMVSFASDASVIQGRPQAAVWPQCTGQVSRLLELAQKEGIPVTPRGSGTGLAGLAVPLKGGLVMDMSRMNRILEISIKDRLAIVEPGVIYETLQKQLAKDNFFFPPDPSSGKVATLGGNVATNAGGIKGAKYGVTKDYVLGLTVVLPGGRILETGAKCIKSVSGYDLTKLFVGSEGTLGVITKITLKVSPRPRFSRAAMAAFQSLPQAGQAVTEIMASGVIPSIMEIMDKTTIGLLNDYADVGLPNAGAILMAETDGFTEEETRAQMALVIYKFRQCGASMVKEAATKEEAEALWAARKSSFAVRTRIKGAVMVEDLAVPLSQVAPAFEIVVDIAHKYDLIMPAVGHVGDGNLHPSFCFDASDEDEVERVHQAGAELFKRIVGLGGTLTGEHGIGAAKAPFMHFEHNPVAMEVMRGLKSFFDPRGIMNPGKMALQDE